MEKRQPRSTDLPPASGSLLFEGDFAFCTLADVLQLVSTSQRAVKVEIYEASGELGHLVVLNGVITQCVAGTNHGENAFFHLWQQRHGRFRVVPATSAHLPDATPMASTWRELVFEAARIEDEAHRTPEQPRVDAGHGDYFELTLSTRPPPALRESREREGRVIPFPRVGHDTGAGGPLPSRAAGRPPSEPAPPKGQLEARLARAMDAYLRRDLPEALRQFEDCLASAPSDVRIQLMVKRIKDRLARG